MSFEINIDYLSSSRILDRQYLPLQMIYQVFQNDHAGSFFEVWKIQRKLPRLEEKGSTREIVVAGWCYRTWCYFSRLAEKPSIYTLRCHLVSDPDGKQALKKKTKQIWYWCGKQDNFIKYTMQIYISSFSIYFCRNLPRNAKNIPIAEKYCNNGSLCW